MGPNQLKAKINWAEQIKIIEILNLRKIEAWIQMFMGWAWLVLGQRRPGEQP